jgi:hypothetical protein
MKSRRSYASITEIGREVIQRKGYIPSIPCIPHILQQRMADSIRTSSR